MKCSRFLVLPLSILLMFLITACPPSGNGDEDDDDNGTAPTVVDVNFYRCINEDPHTCNDQQDWFHVGDYYNRWIECYDPDLDLVSRHSTWHHLEDGVYEIYRSYITETSSLGSETFVVSWAENQIMDVPINSLPVPMLQP